MLIGRRMPPPIETAQSEAQAGFTVETNADGVAPTIELPEGTYVQPEGQPTAPSETAREPPVRKKPSLTEQPTEASLGVCPKCGRPVYNTNIGKTEQGQPYHKECV